MAHPSPGAGRSMLRAVALLSTVCLAGGVSVLAAPSSGVTTSHRVVLGDTLWGLARASHTTVARLEALNALSSETIQLGQTLQLPSTVAATAGPTGPATSTWSPTAVVRSRGLVTQRIIPTRSTAEAMIRTEALRQGVSPSLALAVAYQESGFTQSMVSPTDAVGIMQIEPETASWVGAYLVGRPLDRYDAGDNILAGVTLLHNLVNATGDTSTAIAAYYQGLKGVQQHGMFTDTRAYVASVLALRSRFR